ncbi:MAG: acetolactate synthase small subunit [Acidimicrobiales bacterium]
MNRRSEDFANHTLTVLVENKAGVLARVADLFARRGYNIVSLAVAPTGDVAFSRITIVVDVESAPLEQIVKQLFKLINVIEIIELPADKSIERELLMATVTVSAADHDSFIDLLARYNATVVGDAAELMTVSMESSPVLVSEFERELERYTIADLQRSGAIALAKTGQDVNRVSI